MGVDERAGRHVLPGRMRRDFPEGWEAAGA